MAGTRSQKQRQAKKARDKKKRELKAANGGQVESEPGISDQCSPEQDIGNDAIGSQQSGIVPVISEEDKVIGENSGDNGSIVEKSAIIADVSERSPEDQETSEIGQENEEFTGVGQVYSTDFETSRGNGSISNHLEGNGTTGEISQEVGTATEIMSESMGSGGKTLENGISEECRVEVVSAVANDGSSASSENSPKEKDIFQSNAAEMRSIHERLRFLKDIERVQEEELLKLTANLEKVTSENCETEKQIAAAAAEVVKLRNEKAALESTVAENTQRVDGEKAAQETLEDETKQAEKEAEECQMKLTALVTEKSHLADKLKASLSLQIELQKSLETETNAMAELDTSVESLKTQVAEEERLLADVLAKLRETISNKERMELELLEQTLSAMKSKLEAAKIAGRETVAKLDSLKQETLHVEAEIVSAAGEQERKKAEAGQQWTPAGSLMTIAGASVLALAFAFVSRF